MTETRSYPLGNARYGVAMLAACGGTPVQPLLCAAEKPKPAGVVGKILRRLILGKPGDRR